MTLTGKKLLLTGYYGFGNTGDEAILAAMLADLRRELEAPQFTVISGNPEHTAAVYGVRAVFWKEPAAIADAVREADLVIVGGGGIFEDYLGIDPDTLFTPDHWCITFYAEPAFLAALFGKRVMMYAVGVGPLSSPLGREYARAAFLVADAVTVRDPGSRKLLLELGVPRRRVRLVADPAFTLELPSPERVAAGEGPLLGVAARHWDVGIEPEVWEGKVATALDRFLEEHGGRVLFVPFQQHSGSRENDHAVAERIRGRMRRDAGILPGSPTPEELGGVLAGCDLILAMRLHALIFAALGKRPVVALSYDPKVREAARLLAVDEVLDVDAFAAEELATQLARVPRPTAARRRALKRLRRRAESTVRTATELLRAGPPPPAPLPAEMRPILARSLHAQITSAAP